jgi:hypothetical protein
VTVAFHLRLAPAEDFRRESLDSPIEQGANETRRYLVDFSEWGVDDTDPVILANTVLKVWSQNENDQDDADVTSTVAAGGILAVNEGIQAYFALAALTAGTKYRWVVKATLTSNVLEPFGFVEATP